MHKIIPRYERNFSMKNQYDFWFGTPYVAKKNEFLVNLGRSGIVMALKACLPRGGRVGIMAYNCKSVADAIIRSGCIPVFIDVTSDFRLDLESLKDSEIEVLIVTNLFGVRNLLNSILSIKPEIITIIDNAHGYGLPIEGDFTIYSINQSKYPSLSEGGILICNNIKYLDNIKNQYEILPEYTRLQEFKLFARLLKAALYQKTLYVFPMALELSQKNGERNLLLSGFSVRKMSNGSRRLYQAWLDSTPQKHRSKLPFVDIVKTDNPERVKKEYFLKGIDADTMFKRWITWATKLGYQKGQCPMAEYLSSHSIMIPNYYKVYG